MDIRLRLLRLRRHTYEEWQNSRSIEAEAKGLDPEERDARCSAKVTAGDVFLATITGDYG